MKDGDAVRAGGGLPAASRTALRGPAVRRLLALRAGEKLTAVHVRVDADAVQQSLLCRHQLRFLRVHGSPLIRPLRPHGHLGRAEATGGSARTRTRPAQRPHPGEFGPLDVAVEHLGAPVHGAFLDESGRPLRRSGTRGRAAAGARGRIWLRPPPLRRNAGGGGRTW